MNSGNNNCIGYNYNSSVPNESRCKQIAFVGTEEEVTEGYKIPMRCEYKINIRYPSQT